MATTTVETKKLETKAIVDQEIIKLTTPTAPLTPEVIKEVATVLSTKIVETSTDVANISVSLEKARKDFEESLANPGGTPSEEVLAAQETLKTAALDMLEVVLTQQTATNAVLTVQQTQNADTEQTVAATTQNVNNTARLIGSLTGTTLTPAQVTKVKEVLTTTVGTTADILAKLKTSLSLSFLANAITAETAITDVNAIVRQIEYAINNSLTLPGITPT